MTMRTKGANMRNLTAILLAAGCMAVAAPARADEPAESQRVIVGAKVGGIAPFDGLSPFVSGGIEAGYLLGHGLAVVLDVDYTQPTKSSSETDPRVAGGTYTWKLTQQELGAMPVVLYRLTWVKGFVPFVGIGPRVLFLKSTVQDNGGPTIQKTTETSTKLGLGLPAGAELALGPGHLIGELLIQYGGIDHTATGNGNTAAVSLSLGYRMFF
jgi:opacity protein-like surface antigen